MKKIFYSMMALAMTATVFTSCENVPAPYSVNFEENNNNTNTPTTPASGTGVEADPFNVAAALKYIDAGQDLDKQVYVSGTIVSVKEIDAANYGNATYLISDDGTTNGQLTVYRGFALGNKKFTANDKLNAGDKVVVYGKLVNYKGQKQFAQGSYIYSLNGNKAAQPTPTADLNTESTAWTVTEAVQKIQANQTATGEAYVKGVISEVVSYNENYKSITYYISDNGTDKTLQVFSGKGLNGADFAAKTDLQAGQTVVVKGNLKAFTNKQGKVIMEIDKNNKIISISGASTPQPAATGLTAKFETGMDNFTINNITLPSDLSFVWKHDASRKQMKASSYKNNTNYAAQSRLESPAFSLVGKTSATLTFQVAANFFTTAADNFKVQVSTDGTTWHDVPVSTYPAKDWNFVTSTCNLSAYAGQSNVRIGFLYTCDGTSAAGTWEIKNVEAK